MDCDSLNMGRAATVTQTQRCIHKTERIQSVLSPSTHSSCESMLVQTSSSIKPRSQKTMSPSCCMLRLK